jgi:hypothetical protein
MAMTEYASSAVVESHHFPGVRYRVAKMSLGRRIELAKKVREIGLKGEFLAAGKGLDERVEASVAEQQVYRVYLEWGLLGVEGLRIDGEAATPAAVIDRGPEKLVAEILASIKRELFLDEADRKN